MLSEQRDGLASFMYVNDKRNMEQFDFMKICANTASLTVNSEESDISSNDEYCMCRANDDDDHVCGDDNICPVCKDMFDVYTIEDHMLEVHNIDMEDPNHSIRRAKIAWRKGLKSNRMNHTDESDNQGYSSPAKYISSDSYEKAKRNYGKIQPYEPAKPVNNPSHYSSSDSSAGLFSSRRERKRKSRNQRDREQTHQKMSLS